MGKFWLFSSFWLSVSLLYSRYPDWSLSAPSIAVYDSILFKVNRVIEIEKETLESIYHSCFLRHWWSNLFCSKSKTRRKESRKESNQEVRCLQENLKEGSQEGWIKKGQESRPRRCCPSSSCFSPSHPSKGRCQEIRQEGHQKGQESWCLQEEVLQMNSCSPYLNLIFYLCAFY